MVPLSWFRVMDAMTAATASASSSAVEAEAAEAVASSSSSTVTAPTTQDCCLSLSTVVELSARCDVPKEEVPLLLSLLHDMGHLMWHDEPDLRNVVILDPVAYLVAPTTIIICKLRPDDDDSTHHFMDSHRVCEQRHKHEWKKLQRHGILHTVLLPILWKDYKQDHIDTLLSLMVKFSLLVPLRSSTSTATSATASTASSVVEEYLVPALLEPAPSASEVLVDWTDQPTQSCYIIFTLTPDLEGMSTIMQADLVEHGFLPGGTFERLIGKVVQWYQTTTKGSSINFDSVVLYKDAAILSFGRQRLRLIHCRDIHSVRVDVEGTYPLVVQQRLVDFVDKIISECMPSLRHMTAVPYFSGAPAAAAAGTGTAANVEDSGNGDEKSTTTATTTTTTSSKVLQKELLPNELLIPLRQLRAAGKGDSMLVWRGGRTLITKKDVVAQYNPWLQLYQPRGHYDVFISYRWGNYDSAFASALFDMCTNFAIGEKRRAIEVFVDRFRLKEGRQFQSDFAAALTHSLLAVPIVSADALQKLLTHDVELVDNVLLEWIMILEASKAKRIERVYPLLFGSRSQHATPPSQEQVQQQDEKQQINTSSLASATTALQVANFFAEGVKDRLPTVIPRATLQLADKLLKENDIIPSAQFHVCTVYSVVEELLKFLLFTAWDKGDPSSLVETCAVHVINVLNECDEAKLDAVTEPELVSPHPPTADAAGATGNALVTPSVLSVTAADRATNSSNSNSNSHPYTGAGAGAGTGTILRALHTLTVLEVGELMDRVGYPKWREPFVERMVTGEVLASCEEASDLADEAVGVDSKLVQKGLMKRIDEWKRDGVHIPATAT
mmetsp:Transcript_32255/g.53892  ORF Transcript_32255/g.53892 Transcript_32255/m.53892 type:complete len:839 (-) Transcript_32255:147-2663(-)